jgi:nucleoside-diphosphate-sugar epimerase
VRGTTSILNSALKHANTVKRVVLTSSFVAVFEWVTEPRVFTEKNWNNAAMEAVKTKDPAPDAFTVYSASKALAEKAAWEFVAAHKSEISWDLVALNFPWIFGASHPLFAISSLTTDYLQPSISPAATVKDINSSQREIYDTLSGARTAEQLRGQGTWVHVAVAAESHVRATHASNAGGERIIVSAGNFFYQDFRKLHIPVPTFHSKTLTDTTRNTSRSGSGAWDPESAARRARINEGHRICLQYRVEKIRGAAWIASSDTSERSGEGIGGGL